MNQSGLGQIAQLCPVGEIIGWNRLCCAILMYKRGRRDESWENNTDGSFQTCEACTPTFVQAQITIANKLPGRRSANGPFPLHIFPGWWKERARLRQVKPLLVCNGDGFVLRGAFPSRRWAGCAHRRTSDWSFFCARGECSCVTACLDASVTR